MEDFFFRISVIDNILNCFLLFRMNGSVGQVIKFGLFKKKIIFIFFLQVIRFSNVSNVGRKQASSRHNI